MWHFLLLHSGVLWEGCPKGLEELPVLQCFSPLLIQTFVRPFCALGALVTFWPFSDHRVCSVFRSSILTSIFRFLWLIPSPQNHLPITCTESVSSPNIMWHVNNTHASTSPHTHKSHPLHLSPGLFVFYFCLLDKLRATELKSSVLIMLLSDSICSGQMECS